MFTPQIKFNITIHSPHIVGPDGCHSKMHNHVMELLEGEPRPLLYRAQTAGEMRVWRKRSIGHSIPDFLLEVEEFIQEWVITCQQELMLDLRVYKASELLRMDGRLSSVADDPVTGLLLFRELAVRTFKEDAASRWISTAEYEFEVLVVEDTLEFDKEQGRVVGIVSLVGKMRAVLDEEDSR